MPERAQDFLTWTSFPSSVKLVNDTEKFLTWRIIPSEKALAVNPGSKLHAEIRVKQEGILGPYKSHLALRAAALPEWPVVDRIMIPNGTFDWSDFTVEADIPSNVSSILVYFATVPKGTNWFDDLRIYQDGVLIYENKFSNWGPFIGIPVPIVAGLGIVRFGKKG